jgi:hypothetical protein
MSALDPRSIYVSNAIASIFGFPELSPKIAASAELAAFLNELEITTL